MANILVYIELDNDHATPNALAALALGRRIATRLGATLHAVLPCEMPPNYGEDDIVAVLSRHGADKVVLTTNCPETLPLAVTHGPALHAACDRFPPLLVLLPLPAGDELGPQLAFHLRAAYCCGAKVDEEEDGEFVFRRDIFGQRFKWREQISTGDTLVLTIQPGADAAEPTCSEEAEVVVLQAPASNHEIEILSCSEHEGTAPGWRRAVVAGGAGIERRESFALIERLAESIDGQAAASQAACERGLTNSAVQVGLGGNRISADYYLAFGISGSKRHLAAIDRDTQVIAINNNERAPIFSIARYGLVADATDTLRTVLGSDAEEDE